MLLVGRLFAQLALILLLALFRAQRVLLAATPMVLFRAPGAQRGNPRVQVKALPQPVRRALLARSQCLEVCALTALLERILSPLQQLVQTVLLGRRQWLALARQLAPAPFVLVVCGLLRLQSAARAKHALQGHSTI